MTWLYIPSLSAQVCADLNSASTLLALEHSSQSCTVSGKPASPKSLRLALKRGRFTRLRFGLTCEPSVMGLFASMLADDAILKESDCSLRDIRVNHSPSPASVAAETIRDTFGLSLWTRLIAIARRCAFLRTSQATFGWGSEPSDEISKSEATRFRRAYSRRLKLVRRTSDYDSSSSPWMTARTSRGQYTRDNGDSMQERLTLEGQSQNWPTPDAALMNNRETPETFEARRTALAVKHRNGNGAGTPLGMSVLQWPTPCTGESLTGHGRRGGKSRNGRQSGQSLEAIARAAGPSFPTPKSSDTSSGQVSPTTLAKNSRPLTEIACQHGRQPDPTPTDGKQCLSDGQNSHPQSRKLNPAFVEWLMGLPLGMTGSECSAIPLYLNVRRQLLSNYLQRITRA